MLKNSLIDMGLSPREADILMTTIEMGAQPASIIAQRVGIGRTTVYKCLIRLTQEGLVTKMQEGGVTQFFCPGALAIKHYIEKQKAHVHELEAGYDEVAEAVTALEPKISRTLPRIRLYEGVDGIRSFFADILDHVSSSGLLKVSYFASNTFSQELGDQSLQLYGESFFSSLTDQGIGVDAYLGDGLLVMERLTVDIGISGDMLKNIPASGSAVNIFVAGNWLCLSIYKDTPISIIIESTELSQAMNFLFDSLKHEH